MPKIQRDETIRAFQKAGPGASMKDLEKAREKLRGKISDKMKSWPLKNDQPATAGLKPSQLKLGETDAHRIHGAEGNREHASRQ